MLIRFISNLLIPSHSIAPVGFANAQAFSQQYSSADRYRIAGRAYPGNGLAFADRAALAGTFFSSGSGTLIVQVDATIEPVGFANEQQFYSVSAADRYRIEWRPYPGDGLLLVDRAAIGGAYVSSGGDIELQVAAQVEPAGLANSQTFGTCALDATIAVVSFDNAQSFGTLAFGSAIAATGFSGSQSFGVPDVAARLEPAAVDNASTFGTSALSGAFAPNGFANAQAFGTQDVAAVIGPAGFANASSFGVPALSPAHAIEPAGFANSATSGSPSVAAQIDAAGFANESSFGTAFIHTGALFPVGLVNAQSFGTVDVAAEIDAVGFENSQSFGRPSTEVVQQSAGGGVAPSRTLRDRLAELEQPLAEHEIAAAGIVSTAEVGRPTIRPIPRHDFAPRQLENVAVFGVPTVSRRRRFAHSPAGPTAVVAQEWSRRRVAPRRTHL